jgi:hypothetical protein
VSGKLKDSGTENTSTKRQRVSLEGGKRLTRWRFVLVLLSRRDVNSNDEKLTVRRDWQSRRSQWHVKEVVKNG